MVIENCQLKKKKTCHSALNGRYFFTKYGPITYVLLLEERTF